MNVIMYIEEYVNKFMYYNFIKFYIKLNKLKFYVK